MFVRKGQALGSILWKDVPKAERPTPAKKPAKKAAPKPEAKLTDTEREADIQAAQSREEPPKHYAAKGDWVDFAVSKGADRSEAEDLTKEELIDKYGEGG